MRLSVEVTVLSLSIVGISAAQHADAAMTRKPTNIPAQPLGAALEVLAKERDLQVIYRSDLVGGLQTAGAVGVFTPEQALGKLLAGTGLTYRYLNETTVTIAPVATGLPTAAPAAGSTTPPSLPADNGNQKGGGSFWDRFLLAQATPGQTANSASREKSIEQAPETKPVQIEEIIVTAQKKAENIQNVPLAVSTISSETFSKFNYTQLSDFAATIPGLQVESGGAPGYMTITLRGITTGNLYGSTTTAMYVDDVPVGPSASYAYGASYDGIDLLPYDLDHVEVLRGPQGTLYGASSMGGLVKYVLSTPDLTKNSFRGGADLSGIDGGSGTGYGFRAYANVAPIPNELAISVSGAHTYTPGFITNVADGQKGINHGTQDGARAALFWQPSDQLSLRLTALINHSDFDFIGEIPLTLSGQPSVGPLAARWLSPTALKVQDRLYSANITYEFAWATLTAVTGYFDANSDAPTDATIYPFFSTVLGILAPSVDELNLKKFSQELRLSSPANKKVQWTLGGFFTREQAALFENIHALNPATGQVNPQYEPIDDVRRPSTFKEAAAYANATYEFTQHWDISAGVRYSHNAQSVSTYGVGANGSGGYLFGGVATPFSTPVFRSSDSTTTYSISSRYHFQPNAMVYARVATGYRPGGSNSGVPGAPPTFEPDTLTNYELGVKSELLDKRILINADAFYIDWQKIQLGEYTPSHLIFTGNAATAVSYGVELTTQYALTPGLRFGVNAVYDNAKLTGDAPAVGGADGNRLPLSPQWSGAVSVDWNHPVTAAYSLTTGVIWRYVGDRITDFPGGGGIPGGSNYLHLPSYNTADLSAGVTNGTWTARLFGRNVTNETAYLRYYAPLAGVMEPRVVGLSVDVVF